MINIRGSERWPNLPDHEGRDPGRRLRRRAGSPLKKRAMSSSLDWTALQSSTALRRRCWTNSRRPIPSSRIGIVIDALCCSPMEIISRQVSICLTWLTGSLRVTDSSRRDSSIPWTSGLPAARSRGHGRTWLLFHARDRTHAGERYRHRRRRNRVLPAGKSGEASCRRAGHPCVWWNEAVGAMP